MILFGNDLVGKLRTLVDKAENRIWMIVPFIGSWAYVEKIIGNRWLTNLKVDIKLLTDIRNEKLINLSTFEKIKNRAEVKTLPGLHAKIYIVDDNCLFSSANLTGTAFSKRYEIGIIQKVDKNILKLFEKWWSLGKTVDNTWMPDNSKSKKEIEETNSDGLKKLWNLPDLPSKISVFKDFVDNYNAYNHFKNIYFSLSKRLHPNLPEFQEIDAFLNYLFHEHENTPSYKYLKNIPRKLNDVKRNMEISKYIDQYSTWLKNNQKYEQYRFKRLREIRSIISKKKIEKLRRTDVEKVTNIFHCMNSMPINKSMFLNPKNNALRTIREQWFKLLFDEYQPIEVRMEECNKKLFRFGKSSIQELIAWYYPDKYPVINGNSNSGLKFFGYEIKTY